MDTPMLEHLADYLEALKKRGDTTATIHNYSHKLRQWGEWQRGRAVTLETLREYRDYLQREKPKHRGGGGPTGEYGLRPRTIRCTFIALYSYFRFLEAEGILPKGVIPPKEAVRIPRLDRPQRTTPTDLEVQAMFKAVDRMPAHTLYKAFLRGRARAMLGILAYCGLRRTEVLELRTSDIQEQSGAWVLRVRRGKGGISRWLELAPTAFERVRDYLEVRRDWMEANGVQETEWLWPVDGSRKLAHKGFEALWEEIQELSGLRERGITPHGMRHWFASRAVAIDGVNIADVQEMLGHSSQQTTLQYLHGSDENKRRALRGLEAALDGGAAGEAPPTAPGSTTRRLSRAPEEEPDHSTTETRRAKQAEAYRLRRRGR